MPIVIEPPSVPIWCSLVTRTISFKSAEGKSEEGMQAVQKEKEGLDKHDTFDYDSGRSFRDWMNDPKVPEAMIGRVFCILGRKHSELEGTNRADESILKCRAVFQGSNVRTKTGRAAHVIYEEVSNAPATLAAARCMLAVAILLQLTVTFRDVAQAYLHAAISGEGRVPTLAELPESWWPDSWFYDGAARTQPRYTRPLVIMRKALYGHPESGHLWDAMFSGVLIGLAWRTVEGWAGVPCRWKHHHSLC